MDRVLFNRIILPLVLTLISSSWSISQTGPVFQVLDFDKVPYTELNRNGHFEEIERNRFVGVQPYSQGYQVQTDQGREGSAAAFCENPNGDKSMGLSWSITLNQTHPEPVRMTGWSRAENVEGSPESNYSLYIDVIYNDGTPSWGHNTPFHTGTHDWEEAQVLVIPEKPIARISCYALFRNKKGRIWFDDISIQSATLNSNMVRLDGLSVQVDNLPDKPTNTQDFSSQDLSIGMDPTNGSIASIVIHNKNLSLPETGSGFLLRDVGEGSGYYAFQDGQCKSLACTLNLTITASERAIQIDGTLEDTRKTPRALNLLYALPIDVLQGHWGDQINQTRSIVSPDDYHSWVQIGTGSNGQLSRYPYACVSTPEIGLAMGIDMGKPCQWRLGYSAGTRLFYLSMDLGLHPETRNFPSKASFRIVIYPIDPDWGFRSAVERYAQIFPDYFTVRSQDQGIWMPFTDVSTVQGWQDFGFKYHEGNNNVPFDDESNILSFRYTEPSTWWMNMDPEIPRTYEAAMQQVQQYAQSDANTSQRKRAQALLASGSFDENGHYQMLFRNEPWANGAVFSLNASPYLAGEYTNASLMWNEELIQQLYGPTSKGTLDGEYLDSLEAYVTADLNFRPDHFQSVTFPLTFTLDTRLPVIYKAFTQYEFTRYLSEQMHARGKLLFANSVPYRYAFLCPWLDVMGTESNWVSNGKFSPDSDEIMNYRRTLSGKKPYLFLMNTDFNHMSYDIVERYFQRCLFYGMFPSMFSHNASEDPYWKNPALYNRDRPLFKKYQPLIKTIAEAGWEPITQVRCDNDALRMERFGSFDQPDIYLTVSNTSTETLTVSIKGEGPLSHSCAWKELLSEKEGLWEGELNLSIESGALHVYQLSPSNPESSVQGSLWN